MSIAAGASCGSIRRDAKKVSTTALTLISPSPRVTGSISLSVRQTAGSRQSITTCRRPSLPRSHGTGSSTWITVPARIDAAYTYSFAFAEWTLGTPIASPAMIARFHATGASAGTENSS